MASKFLCLLLITGLALSTPSSATTYDVGGLTGWSPALVPLLPAWLTGKVFFVNDALRFVTYSLNLLPLPLPLALSVPFYLVKADEYANCIVPPFSSNFPTTVLFPLTTPGVHYFISDALSCALGLKFQINVVVN